MGITTVRTETTTATGRVHVESTTTYECDRCRFKSDKANYRNGHGTVKHHVESVMLGGDVGGYDRSYYLCGKCSRELETWLLPPVVPEGDSSGETSR